MSMHPKKRLGWASGERPRRGQPGLLQPPTAWLSGDLALPVDVPAWGPLGTVCLEKKPTFSTVIETYIVPRKRDMTGWMAECAVPRPGTSCLPSGAPRRRASWVRSSELPAASGTKPLGSSIPASPPAPRSSLRTVQPGQSPGVAKSVAAPEAGGRWQSSGSLAPPTP